MIARRISLAPMLDWTDRHYRHFLRLITKEMYFYTEMVTTGAILHGDKNRHLDFSKEEHPVALQLGGSNVDDLTTSAKIAEQWGYDEVNLNVGCPSARVQSGSFGACIMAEPALVSKAINSMQKAVSIPVTVKTRIGIDNFDNWEFLEKFITTVADGGCDTFILHARKAHLKGLSPKENRQIPPLNYERVYKVKERWPNLEISINGGFRDLDTVEQQLKYVDGVMIGREAYENPYSLATVDQRFYNSTDPVKTRSEIFEGMFPYIEEALNNGDSMKWITRHLMGLFHGIPGGKQFRRVLSDGTAKGLGDMELLYSILKDMPNDI